MYTGLIMELDGMAISNTNQVVPSASMMNSGSHRESMFNSKIESSPCKYRRNM